jgi:hypothetical protein
VSPEVVTADLDGLARGFAERMQDVLNKTVCDCVHLPAVTRPNATVLVGCGLSKDTFTTEPFRVGLRKRRPQCWLDVFFRLCMDGSGNYLTVTTSFFGIFAADDEKSCLCHFDYERDKAHGYPEAHLQVHGDSSALASWKSQQKKPLAKLHFPVGGRRYRPTLEDVIEFLIVERLADPREGWEDVLNTQRRDFQRIQLRAAIRRDPETARQAITDLGSSDL